MSKNSHRFSPWINSWRIFSCWRKNPLRRASQRRLWQSYTRERTWSGLTGLR